MYPILFKVGPITVYAYGTMLAIAFIVGLYLARQEFKKRKINPDFAYDFALAIALGSIIGARLFYIIGHWSYYHSHLGEIIQVQQGGLVFYGGLLGGILGAWLIVRLRRLSLLKVADSLASPLALGTAIGRIGCFLNGCCYGIPTKLPWGIKFFDVPRHPSQIYELLQSLAIFLFLYLYAGKKVKLKSDGSIFLIYLLLYSFGRFWLEFLRDSPHILRYFTFSQLASLVIFVVAGYLFFQRFRLKRV